MQSSGIYIHFSRIYFYRLAFFAGVPVLKPTEQCSSFGGMCVHEEDCSESTSPKGMCTERGTNLECCYIGNAIGNSNKFTFHISVTL